MNPIPEIINYKKNENILDRIDRDLFIIKIISFINVLLVVLLLFST